MFSTSKDKIDEVYAFSQSYFNIEEDVSLNKYLWIDLEHHPYGSIHLRQPYLTQRIVNMIPVMYNSSDKPTPMFDPLLEKMRGLK